MDLSRAGILIVADHRGAADHFMALIGSAAIEEFSGTEREAETVAASVGVSREPAAVRSRLRLAVGSRA